MVQEVASPGVSVPVEVVAPPGNLGCRKARPQFIALSFGKVGTSAEHACRLGSRNYQICDGEMRNSPARIGLVLAAGGLLSLVGTLLGCVESPSSAASAPGGRAQSAPAARPPSGSDAKPPSVVAFQNVKVFDGKSDKL